MPIFTLRCMAHSGALTQALLAALLIRVRAAYYRHRFLKRQAL
jgi:hypothetical protein